MERSFNDRILSNFGGIDSKNFNYIMEPDSSESGEFSMRSYSPYKLMEEMPNYFKTSHEDFSVMTLNCQSLNAKFDKIKTLIMYLKDNGLLIKCICLQETWVKSNQPDKCADLSAFILPGYQDPIGQSATCGQHGGLAIYLIEGLQASILHSHTESNIWEGLFINVTGECLNKPLVIGNVYRPPRDNNDNRSIESFISEFTPIIHKISKMKCEAIITCDNNIDLLQINNREKYADYFDLMITNGLFPKITFPTRFSNRNATLIDQIFHKSSISNHNAKSAILWGAISDHLACISVL